MKAHLKKREIGERVVVVEFEVAHEFTFQPGEYVQIVLGPELKHYFSVASSPSDKGIIRIATRPSHSLFKTTLQAMPLGTDVEVNGPWGDVLLPKDTSKKLVFIAGGIGITPFLSMISFASEHKSPYQINLLCFGELDEFHHELEKAAEVNSNFRFHHFYEPVSKEILKANLSDFDRIFYVAGPPGFVNETLNLLAELKIPPAQIIHESYTGY